VGGCINPQGARFSVRCQVAAAESLQELHVAGLIEKSSLAASNAWFAALPRGQLKEIPEAVRKAFSSDPPA